MLHDYLLYLQAKFFDDSLMESNLEQMDYFTEKGYVKFSPELTEKTVNGHRCTEVSYVTDLTNITAGESIRFGISLTSPKVFSWNMCIDNKTGIAYTKHFNYSYVGRQHSWDFELIDYEWYTTRQVIPPENITEGAYDVLLEESEWKNQLQGCYSGEEDEKDRCVALLALQLKMKSLCDLAGERRDRCLVSVVPLTLDESICSEITDAGYRDDCYIEMAGGTKNSSYCSYITNSSKIELCMNVSQKETAGIPNPAAVNCADKGYGYEIRTDNETGGQYGICSYEGFECEEWALYRQECCLTDGDCPEDTSCTGQVCVGAGDNETNSTVDMQEFLEYLEDFGEDNETESS
jgi:putative hemolysin